MIQSNNFVSILYHSKILDSPQEDFVGEFPVVKNILKSDLL